MFNNKLWTCLESEQGMEGGLVGVLEAVQDELARIRGGKRCRCGLEPKPALHEERSRWTQNKHPISFTRCYVSPFLFIFSVFMRTCTPFPARPYNALSERCDATYSAQEKAPLLLRCTVSMCYGHQERLRGDARRLCSYNGNKMFLFLRLGSRGSVSKEKPYSPVPQMTPRRS